jgi:hypothetical protein
MKKQIRTFILTFVIGVPIGILILYLISLSGLEKNTQQIKFEEERALLYDNQSSLTTARDVDCNFINKYGTTFVNWTGEIKSIDEEHIVILSDANGIEVQYKIFDWVLDLGGFHSHYDSITGNVNDRTLNNEALDVGDNVYFSFHPVQSESDEDECFDETSFTKKGGLKAPEYMADIFRISKNPWKITHEQISKIKNKYNEELAKKARIKQEKERRDRLERGKFNNKEDFAEWVRYKRSFKGRMKTSEIKRLIEFGENNTFLLKITDRYGQFDSKPHYGTYTVKTANYFKDGEKYYYLELDYDDARWATFQKGYLVYRFKKLVEPRMGGDNYYITDEYGFKKSYVGFLARRWDQYEPTTKTFLLKEKNQKMCKFCPDIPAEDNSYMCVGCITKLLEQEENAES